MVSSGQVNGDWSSLKSILDNYNNEMDGLSSNWKGASYDGINQKAEEFISEYSGTISGEMSSFANACDLYEKYKTAKTNMQTAQSNYNTAVTNKDSSAANTYSSQVSNYQNEMNSLKSQIEAALTSASSTKLTATSNTASDEATTSGDSTTTTKTGNIDMSNYPTGKSKEDGLARATLVAKYLVENGGFTKEQAAAMVGVYLDENNCDPTTYMKAEKEGRGAKGTGGNGYGAGIASWTFVDFKNQCLRDAGLPENTPIENLSLQQQCDMIIAMSKGSNKKYYDALKRCDNIEDASATAVIITGDISYSKNWDTHPTQAEAKALSDHYGQSNDARYGASEYHWNLDKRRLDLAKQVYQNL